MVKSDYSILLICVLLSTLLIHCDKAKDQNKQPHGRSIHPDHTVTILDEQNEPVTKVRVAVARTKNERNTGLMDVHNLPFDTGMLFIFDHQRPRSFWMANTPLSLDIIFINSDFEIVRIRTETTPYSRRQITSEHPAQYVLEVNAGFAQEFDIKEGMRISW